MNGRAWFGLLVLSGLGGIAACGGESESEGNGGSSSGGTGGSGASTSAGGKSGSGGNTSGGGGGTSGGGGGTSSGGGGTSSGGSAGGPSGGSGGAATGGSAGAGGAIGDASPDALSCPNNQVPTADGCLGCKDAADKLTAHIEQARTANASCTAVTDCVLTGASTTCWGACPIAVSKNGESAFQATLAKLNDAYCSGYVPVCGYVTPKCAQATLECTSGVCQATYK